MSRTATVNYHVRSDERQAYQIDAGGVVGQVVSPEHAPTEVDLKDQRLGEADVSFDADGVEFAVLPTEADIGHAKDWERAYDAELEAFLKRRLRAVEVEIFDHTIREDDPNSGRKPARNVHSDYSAEGAETRLEAILGKDRAAEWRKGHYRFVNVWRPLDNPINSAPLGFVRPVSVADGDWMLIDLIYPDRRGHIMGLAANPGHEWLYRSRMTPDEIAFFNIYDNRGLPSVGHSAMERTEDPAVTTIRKSLESRTLLRLA